MAVTEDASGVFSMVLQSLNAIVMDELVVADEAEVWERIRVVE